MPPELARALLIALPMFAFLLVLGGFVFLIHVSKGDLDG